MVLEARGPKYGVSRAVLPPKGLGENLSSPLLVPVAGGVS